MESVEEIIFVMMSLVFLLMGIVLIASIIMSAYNPYEQITFANTEKLRSAINEACFREAGSNNPVKISFDMPQNTPLFSGLFTILPAWIMRTGGDPNYVLYYESFPPGEAIGWEVYHNYIEHRIIVPLPDGYKEKSFEDVKKYAKEVYDDYKNRNKDAVIDAVVINNIILNDDYRSDFIVDRKVKIDDTTTADDLFIAGRTKKGEEKKGFFGYGEWEKDTDTYKFTNYMGLSPLEKISVKYQPCGENSLCLKTRSGVYKFPLDACRDIGYIQLVYDARGKISDISKFVLNNLGVAGGALATYFAPGKLKIFTLIGTGFFATNVFEAEFALLLSFKASEFYASSPCNIKTLEIEKTDCSGGVYTCNNMMKYPLYMYDKNDELKSVGEHFSCMDSLIQIPPSSYQKPQSCLIVKVYDKPDGFCWTPDPYNKPALEATTKTGLFAEFFELFLDPFTVDWASKYKMYPVLFSRIYIDPINSFVLTPPKDVGEGLKVFGLIKSSMSWAWP